MTIREVIELLKTIFETLMALIGPLFGGEKEEGTEDETTQA